MVSTAESEMSGGNATVFDFGWALRMHKAFVASNNATGFAPMPQRWEDKTATVVVGAPFFLVEPSQDSKAVAKVPFGFFQARWPFEEDEVAPIVLLPPCVLLPYGSTAMGFIIPPLEVNAGGVIVTCFSSSGLGLAGEPTSITASSKALVVVQPITFSAVGEYNPSSAAAFELAVLQHVVSPHSATLYVRAPHASAAGPMLVESALHASLSPAIFHAPPTFDAALWAQTAATFFGLAVLQHVVSPRPTLCYLRVLHDSAAGLGIAMSGVEPVALYAAVGFDFPFPFSHVVHAALPAGKAAAAAAADDMAAVDMALVLCASASASSDLLVPDGEDGVKSGMPVQVSEGPAEGAFEFDDGGMQRLPEQMVGLLGFVILIAIAGLLTCWLRKATRHTLPRPVIHHGMEIGPNENLALDHAASDLEKYVNCVCLCVVCLCKSM